MNKIQLIALVALSFTFVVQADERVLVMMDGKPAVTIGDFNEKKEMSFLVNDYFRSKSLDLARKEEFNREFLEELIFQVLVSRWIEENKLYDENNNWYRLKHRKNIHNEVSVFDQLLDNELKNTIKGVANVQVDVHNLFTQKMEDLKKKYKILVATRLDKPIDKDVLATIDGQPLITVNDFAMEKKALLETVDGLSKQVEKENPIQCDSSRLRDMVNNEIIAKYVAESGINQKIRYKAAQNDLEYLFRRDIFHKKFPSRDQENKKIEELKKEHNIVVNEELLKEISQGK